VSFAVIRRCVRTVTILPGLLYAGKRFKQDGSVSVDKSGRPHGPKMVAHRDFLIAMMKGQDNTLDGIVTLLKVGLRKYPDLANHTAEVASY
jgi:hypothetical protein